jgi:Na+/melibiose symporter-like transporter
VLPGSIAMAIVWFAWIEKPRNAAKRLSVDYPGAALLTLGALSLLWGLSDLTSPLGWICLVMAGGLFAGLIVVERRAADPMLPLHLFRDRLFSVSILHGILSGWAMFGSMNFIPLFIQAVLGTSATQAGITLTPSSLGWTIASIFGSGLLLRMGYRTLALVGMVMLVTGTFLMTGIGIHTSQAAIMLYTTMMGIGMGVSYPAFLIAVQSTVSKEELGVATSTLQFSRSIGGTLGVSILGVFLSARLSSLLLADGINPTSVSLDSLLDPLANTGLALEGSLRQALATSIANMFIIAVLASVLGLVVVLFTPGGRISQIVRQRANGKSPEIESDIEGI